MRDDHKMAAALASSSLRPVVEGSPVGGITTRGTSHLQGVAQCHDRTGTWGVWAHTNARRMSGAKACLRDQSFQTGGWGRGQRSRR